MFFEEISICNVGLFRGENTIKLTPPSVDQPVILIGGLNGSGKTTILDAIQLALYGKRARLSNRGNLSYEEYLRRSINKNVKAGSIASVSLKFRQWIDGKEHVYCILRTWKENGRGIIENLSVTQNSSLDKFLTETWAEYVEELIPVEISQLFFFDGEKIESYANYESSAQLVSRAIHSLLGLDIVNNLTSDLITLERNKRIALKGQTEKHKIDQLKTNIDQLNKKYEDLAMDRASLQNKFDYHCKDLRQIQEEYNKSGGSLFDKREEIEKTLRILSEDLLKIEGDLRSTVADSLPLLLVPNLLSEINEQILKEKEAKEASVVEQVLIKRDKQLLEFMELHQTCAPALEVVKKFLVKDKESRKHLSTDTDIFLNLPLESERDILNLETNTLPHARAKLLELLDKEDKLQKQIIELERKLAAIPAQDLVKELTLKREKAQQSIDEFQRALNKIDEELKYLTTERELMEKELVGQIENYVNNEFKFEESERIVRHTQGVRTSLDKFRIAIVTKHAEQIANLILDSFSNLTRKDSLVKDVTINTQTFTIELIGSDGKVISPERLSAGERQLLAVSILWGLARASGRPLPIVIDTPLGRLDNTHRQKLVESYFPNASHQILLLSTDEEIDKQHYKKLKPFIGHKYHLKFDNLTGSSGIESGYFWE